MTNPEPLVAKGDGVCDVMMLNSGDLMVTTKDQWIETHEDEKMTPPIMTFVIKHDGKYYLWDLGTRPDFEETFDPKILAHFKAGAPIIHRDLPKDIPEDCKPISGVFVSHFHWDHCGDPSKVPEGVPVYVGRGTMDGMTTGGFGEHLGPTPKEVLDRVQEAPEGDTTVLGSPYKGWDVFGDGSFIYLPAPGHCTGHTIGVVRVKKNPDSYIILGSDSGHNRALYEPCPCHHRTANFGTMALHLKPEESKANLARLTKIHERDDSWVIVSHEIEVEKLVPQEEWLSDWQKKGYKEQVNQLRAKNSLVDCFADSMKPQKVVGEESYDGQKSRI